MFPFVSDDQPKKILSHKEKKELKKKKKMDVGKNSVEICVKNGKPSKIYQTFSLTSLLQ